MSATHAAPGAEGATPPGPAVWAVLTFAFWISMAGTTMPTPLYPLYVRAFGFSDLTITVIFAVYAIGVVAGLLVFGRLSDQIGRRPVVLLSLLLSAAAAVFFIVAHGLAMVLVARMLSGFSAALITGGATAGLLDLARPERQRRAGTVAIAANMGGLAGGNLLAGVLAEWAGSPLRLPWIIDLALVVLALIGCLWLLPETVESPTGFRFQLQPLRVPGAIRAVFLRTSLTSGSGFAVTGLLGSVTGLFLGGVLHLTDQALTGLIVAVAFLCTALGQLAAGRLRSDTALPTACAGLVAAAVLIAVALLAEQLAPLVVGSALTGLGTGVAMSNGLGAINAATPPQQRGEVVSTFFAILYLMLSVPVVGVGVLVQLTNLRIGGVVFSAGVALLAAGVAAGTLRSRRSAD
ncbi:MFS transporter [Streptomyces sp. NPDC092296]|uniref:MFS transporter n=1 Tax=Streptomyces sp. NPDC092296 TaxID=3366012 RepID=UPI0037F85B8B